MRVSQNESWALPAAAWEAADLHAAGYLDLGATPATAGAHALVDALTAAVVASEAGAGRGNARGAVGQAKLRRAVAGIVGGVLRVWGHKGAAVWHQREPAAFTGAPIAHRQFIAAADGLTRLGLLQAAPSIRYRVEYGEDWSHSTGKAARWRPTARLLELATGRGITPGGVREAFVMEFSPVPPKVPREVIVRRPLREGRRPGQGGGQRGPGIPTAPDDQVALRLAAEVAETNEWAAEHEVRGCAAPRWWRPFGPDWSLGGRWAAVGGSGVYQRLPKAERQRMTINGAAVAEVDVVASHLSIMHGLLGLELPEGDLYAVPGWPREAVKAWVTATLGKGTAVRRWSARAVLEAPALKGCAAAAVGAAVMARYPFLERPAAAVAGVAGLERLRHLGTPERLLTHRLQGIEAGAVSRAMEFLRVARGVLALPVHDSLIVPAAAVARTRETLGLAFHAAARVTVRTKAD